MTSPSREQVVSLGHYERVVAEMIAKMDREQIVDRIWRKDATVWKEEESHRKVISNALGWLEVVPWVRAQVNELQGFADEVRSEMSHVVVLGMGGSSLCAEVMRRSFPPVAQFPTLEVLDSTVPAAVRALEARIDLEKTLFIVASKSGGTTEPQVFHRYFYHQLKQRKGEQAGRNFIAITDEGTQLAREALRDGFRRIFVNPSDIGGRYSALSLFGMVPAALAGIDIYTLLDRALKAIHACMSRTPSENPGAQLGAILGTLAKEGRDKITLIAAPPVDTIGLWIEQLIAESTGKEGKGILPVALEPTIPVPAYGVDRLFAVIRLRDDDSLSETVTALTDAGHPVVERLLDDALDLGAEFFTWEFATAVAGWVLGINPFDQPNVQESKDNTKRLLQEFKDRGALPDQRLLAEQDGLRVYGGESQAAASAADVIAAHLRGVKRGDYVALTQYFEETPVREQLLSEIRALIARNLYAATTSGYGPRFLHSTGQLHKGGDDSGVFIQMTASKADDLAIPDEPFTFGTLAQAQALGDFQSLANRDRRAIRVNLGDDVDAGLSKLASIVRESVGR